LKQLLTLTGLVLSLAACTDRISLETPPIPGNYPQILRLTAHPMIIHRGESAVLHWDARNTGKVTLEQALDPKADIRAEFESLGTFAASDSLEVRPLGSTTYIVSCGNEIIGCSSASVHIIVK